MNAHNQAAQIAAYLGATGSGKTTRIKRELARRRPRRLLVWDPQDQYEAPQVRTLSELRRLLATAGGRGPFAYRYVPSLDPKAMPVEFDAFCSLAFAAGHLVLVAEELGDVTRPGWSPRGWSMCTRKGRARGLVIYGTSQRPQDVDKTFFDNCSVIACGRLNAPLSLAYMGRALGVPAEQIAELAPLEYVQRDTATGKITRGRIAPLA